MKRSLVVWIVHLGEELPGVDGVVKEYRCQMLGRALARRGHVVMRLAPRFNHYTKHQRTGPSEIELEPNLFVRLLDARGYSNHVGARRMLFHWQCARGILRLAAEEGPPDVIVCGMPTPGICAAGARLAKLYNTRLIVDIRDLWPDIFLESVPPITRPLASMIGKYVRSVNRRSFARASALVGISSSYASWGVEVAGPKFSGVSLVIPMGCEELASKLRGLSPRVLSRWRRELELSGEEIVAVFMGTIGRQFDLKTVVDAAKILTSYGQARVKFVIAGDGDGLVGVRKLSEGVSTVQCVGWVRGEDRLALLRLADIGLAPYAAGSKMSLPNKPFEYMAVGLPVLSSLPGELADIIEAGRCGANYAASDPRSLVDAVLRLVRNEGELETCSCRSAELYVERYHPSSLYGRFAALIENIGTPS